MADTQASPPASQNETKVNPASTGEKPKIEPIKPLQPNNPETISLLNQKEQSMVKILQDAQEAHNALKAETPKTPDSKLLAGAKAVTAAAILSTTGLAQETLKPKVQPAEVQVAPTEMVSEEELFTLAKYRDRDRLERWPTLTPEQKNRVLHYFALGKKMNLDERGMKRLGGKLLSFYETANEQKKIIMGDDSIKSVLSLTVIGGELEEIFPGAGFAKKGAELDAAITQYLSNTSAELRKESAELRKESAELRKESAELDKKSVEIRKQTEILRMLVKRLEQL